MSYIQQITLVLYVRDGLTEKDSQILDEIQEFMFLPKLPDEDLIEFFGAELSLGYLEFHKQFELDEIIKNTANPTSESEYEIAPEQLQNIIGEFRMHIDTLKDDEIKKEKLRIERKMSDLFQLSELHDFRWSIHYWHEG
jgi:hypothetical protein